MKKIDAVVVDINLKKPFTYRPPFNIEEEPKFTENDYKVVNKLFLTFQSIFPAFKQAWPTESDFEAAKREWMKAFRIAGLTDLEKIKYGVNKYRLLPNPFAPSPGQFIAMCNPSPEDLGLPSSFEAWKQVSTQIGNARRQFSHKVIDHAFLETGLWNFTHLSAKDAQALFFRNYEITLQMYIEGKTLREIPKAIEHKYYKKPSSDKIINSELAKMKELLK